MLACKLKRKGTRATTVLGEGNNSREAEDGEDNSKEVVADGEDNNKEAEDNNKVVADLGQWDSRTKELGETIPKEPNGLQSRRKKMNLISFNQEVKTD